MNGRHLMPEYAGAARGGYDLAAVSQLMTRTTKRFILN